MGTEQEKIKVAVAAVQFIADKLQPDTIIGVGTGSTINYFIDELKSVRQLFAAAVPSSVATEKRLLESGIKVVDPNISSVSTYIDGADEADANLVLIKGRGGALTREKILAESANQFICLVDSSKMSTQIGAFPLPVEVLSVGLELVSRKLEELGGTVSLRTGFISDNQHPIVDVQGLDFSNPVALESKINNIPGVVCCGIFARRPADILLLATDSEVQTLTSSAPLQ